MQSDTNSPCSLQCATGEGHWGAQKSALRALPPYSPPSMAVRRDPLEHRSWTGRIRIHASGLVFHSSERLESDSRHGECSTSVSAVNSYIDGKPRHRLAGRDQPPERGLESEVRQTSLTRDRFLQCPDALCLVPTILAPDLDQKPSARRHQRVGSPGPSARALSNPLLIGCASRWLIPLM